MRYDCNPCINFAETLLFAVEKYTSELSALTACTFLIFQQLVFQSVLKEKTK